MKNKRSLNKILIGIVLGSAILGVGGALASKKKTNKWVKYIKKGNQNAIKFLKNLFKTRDKNEWK